MALPTISEGDLLNKGTTGMPANPELSVADLQAKFDELSLDVIVPKFQALVTALENASAGVDLGVTTPSGITASNKVKSVLDAMAVILLALKETAEIDYDRLVSVFAGITNVVGAVDGLDVTIPTCRAIADYVQNMGGGDMLRTIYDTDDSGVVDNAERLGGVLASAYALQSNLTLYVTTTGNDTTGDGTSGSPYSTISKAISVIPKNLNGYTATINIASGTYTENVLVVGIHGGGLVVSVTGVVTINGYISASTTSASISINTATSGSLVINNTPNFVNGAIFVASCSIFSIGVPTTINSTTMGMFVVSGSSFYSGGLLTINNTTGGSVRVGASAKASIVGGITGSNNAIGLWADASSISYATYSLTATTPFLKGNGGVIANELYPTGGIVAWSSGLAPVNYLCYKKENIVKLDFVMPTTAGIVNGAVIGQLPAGFRPSVQTGYKMGGTAYDKTYPSGTDRSFGITCNIDTSGFINLSSYLGATMFGAGVEIEFIVP